MPFSYYEITFSLERSKIQLSAVEKLYIVAILLKNIHNCIYGSTISEYFDCKPPTISEYMRCPEREINISI